MKNSVLGLCLAVLGLVAVAPLAAQSPTLNRVEELARMGRAEEARVELMDWWARPRSDASQRDLQLGLWLRGRLTVDPAQAELDFQRLVVLYPSSPYAPQALLRLAQSSHARGDAEAARRHVATLVRDYPSSDSRTRAETWLRGAGAPGTPTATVAAPSAPAARDSTVRPPPAPADTASAATPPFREPRAAPSEATWFVQFGAFADEDRAFELHEGLIDAGLAARLVTVQGSAFLHVRIGRFTTRDEASDQLEQVRGRGYSAAIVRDERPETLVRR